MKRQTSWVQEWSYINTHVGRSPEQLLLQSWCLWSSLTVKHVATAVTGGYLNKVRTVKCSHDWLLGGGGVVGGRSPPGNPEEDVYVKQEVILHKSSCLFHRLAFFPTVWVAYVWAAAPLPARRVSASLRRRLTNHLDAVLLELRSEQRVLVLQLFDLEDRNEQKGKVSLTTSSSPSRLYIAPRLETKLWRLKTERAGWAYCTDSIPGIKEWHVQPFTDTPVHNQLDYQNLRCVIFATFPRSESWIPCLPSEGRGKDIELWASE